MLVVLSGLPGAGKSHLAQGLARALPAVVVSVDPIEDAMIRSGLAMSFETGLAAYLVGATIAAEQLRHGFTVIADAANDLAVGRDVWRGVARETGVRTKAIEVTCSDLDLHRSRLQQRQRGLAAYPEPTWDHVVARAAAAEPWTTPRVVLDSAVDRDELLDLAVAYVTGPELVVDGSAFDDLDGFAAEFSRQLDGRSWRGNLDAFDDILSGGFGTPEEGFTLRWEYADRSRRCLGHAAMAARCEALLATCHPSNRELVAEELDAARRGAGPTLFDLIVEIIRDHGPGGRAATDRVFLELVEEPTGTPGGTLDTTPGGTETG